MTLLSAFTCGILFAIGLGLGGMTQPARIIGFLDVAGHWDPSLLLVLGGAVSVSMTLFPTILARGGPLLETRFVLPEQRRIDAPLLMGAGLFGVGWGLSGYCPGPAIVSVVTATPSVLIFLATMLIGLGVDTGWPKAALAHQTAALSRLSWVCMSRASRSRLTPSATATSAIMIPAPRPRGGCRDDRTAPVP